MREIGLVLSIITILALLNGCDGKFLDPAFFRKSPEVRTTQAPAPVPLPPVRPVPPPPPKPKEPAFPVAGRWTGTLLDDPYLDKIAASFEVVFHQRGTLVSGAITAARGVDLTGKPVVLIPDGTVEGQLLGWSIQFVQSAGTPAEVVFSGGITKDKRELVGGYWNRATKRGGIWKLSRQD